MGSMNGRAARRCMAGLWMLALYACGGTARGADESEVEQEAKTLKDHTAGKACASDNECENGSCKRELPEFPGLARPALPAEDGFCSFSCRINVDCGAGAVCIGAGTNAFGFNNPDEKGLCLAYCDAYTACRDGYMCLDLFGQPLGSETGAQFTAGTCQPPPI